MPRFLHIRTARFPILAGEDEELINPWTYGKSFAEYLQTRLIKIGYNCPYVCCEDWGWWVTVKLEQKSIGLTCYREHDQAGPCGFVCGTSPESSRLWSWRRFRRVDISHELNLLTSHLKQIFMDDPDIVFISASDAFPDIDFIRNGLEVPR